MLTTTRLTIEDITGDLAISKIQYIVHLQKKSIIQYT